MKKTILWLIITIFILSLTLIGSGCKEEVTPTEEVTEEVTEEEAEEGEEEEEEEIVEMTEPVTITFWHTYTVETTEYETLKNELIPKFETENPNIKVNEVQNPPDDFHTKLITAIAGEEVPDIARVDIIWVPELAQLGALAAINENASFSSIADGVFPGPLSTCKWGDNYFGLPLSTNTQVIFWNKSMFEEVGINNPPTNWDEFATACKELTNQGTSWGYLYGDTTGWSLLPWILSGGGRLTDENITTASGYINGEKSVSAIQFIVDLATEGYIVDYTTSGVGVGDGYVAKQFGMFFGGPWWFSIIGGQYPDAEINTALFPSGDGGSITVTGGEDLIIFEKSQNKEAAYKFMEFMLSEETQLTMAETGQLPVLSVIAESDFIKNHPYYPIFLEQLKTAQARTPHPGWQKMDDALSLGIQEAISGQKSVQEAMDEVADKVNSIIEEYK